MSDIDTRLANRILLGLVIGAIAGAITLVIGGSVPGLLTGARWLATTVLDPIGQVFLRMLFFVVIPLVFASLAYGVANWFFYNGETDRSIRALEQLIAGGQWTSFGYIAAEADLARLRRVR